MFYLVVDREAGELFFIIISYPEQRIPNVSIKNVKTFFVETRN